MTEPEVLPETIFTALEFPRKYLYSNGLPFNNALAENLDRIKYKILHDKEAGIVLIDGKVGMGKTNTGINALIYLQQGEIDLENQYACGGEVFLEKLEICHKLGYHYIIYDELSDLHKRGALSSFNKVLNRTFDTFRVYEILVIGILPRIDSLENEVFKTELPRLLIHINKKSQDAGYNSGKCYSLYRTNLIRERMEKLGKRQTLAYKMVTPNFHFKSKVLPPERNKEITALALKYKKMIQSESSIKLSGHLNIKDLAHELNMGEMWVRVKIGLLKIKPIKVFKRKNYYDKDTVDLLETYIVRKK
jgi:hypothetical protein